jgi:hypothetical protein
MLPVDAAHLYGHILPSAVAAHHAPDHASPFDDPVAIAYLYLDADARFFGPQCFSLLLPRSPWSQREQGSEPSLPSQAMPSPTHEALHRCNAPASSEKYIGPGPSLRFGVRRAAWEREADGYARRRNITAFGASG